jgi:hypothetical protein
LDRSERGDLLKNQHNAGMDADKQRINASLTFLAVLLVVLLLYVGSYLALVQPSGVFVQRLWRQESGELIIGNWYYHYGEHWAEGFYRPLAQIDRKVQLAIVAPAGRDGGASFHSALSAG